MIHEVKAGHKCIKIQELSSFITKKNSLIMYIFTQNNNNTFNVEKFTKYYITVQFIIVLYAHTLNSCRANTVVEFIDFNCSN